jgi:hypothetical protein
MKWIKLSEQKHPAFLQPVFLYKAVDPEIEGDEEEYGYGHLVSIDLGKDFGFHLGGIMKVKSELHSDLIRINFTHYAIPEPPKKRTKVERPDTNASYKNHTS